MFSAGNHHQPSFRIVCHLCIRPRRNFFKLVFWIAACLRLETPFHDSRPKIIHHKPRFLDTVGFNLTPPVLTSGFCFFSKRVTGCKVYYSCHAVIYNTLMLGEGERSRDLRSVSALCVAINRRRSAEAALVTDCCAEPRPTKRSACAGNL